MEELSNKKIAVLAIIISNFQSVEKVNSVLHDFRDSVVGRMGLPYKERAVSVISVILDASQEILNSISGKLGMIDGVKSKLLITK